MRITTVFLFLLTPLLMIVRISSINAQIRINEIGIEEIPQTIELLNTSSESADISHWYLDDSGGITYYIIPNNTYLYPYSCIVFAYDLNLNKSSADTARLFDSTAPPTSNSAHLIDSYSYKLSPGNELTYSRVPDGEDLWIATHASFGLWNSTRQNCIILPTSTPTPEPTPITVQIFTITPTDIPNQILTISPASYSSTYESIYISEVMVYPEKNNPEWIELYNNNDFPVSLQTWFFDDLENEGSSPKLFSLEIPAKQYGTFELTSSLFNNDGDSVRLLDANKNEKDSFEFSNATQGKTFGRISFESDAFCLQEPSKNISNNPCIESSLKSVTIVSIIPTNNYSIQPKKQNILTQQITQSTYSTLPTKNNMRPLQKKVLGENTQRYLSEATPAYFHQTPFYVSFSYSLLTIFSVLIKMRNAF